MGQLVLLFAILHFSTSAKQTLVRILDWVLQSLASVILQDTNEQLEDAKGEISSLRDAMEVLKKGYQQKIERYTQALIASKKVISEVGLSHRSAKLPI